MNEDCVVEVIHPSPVDGKESSSVEPRPQLVRLIVLDTHRLFRECLAAALRDDAGFARVEVAEAEGTALARLAACGQGDVLVLGGGDAARLKELLLEARERVPDAKILVLGTEDGQEEALGLLGQGAK